MGIKRDRDRKRYINGIKSGMRIKRDKKGMGLYFQIRQFNYLYFNYLYLIIFINITEMVNYIIIEVFRNA